MSPKTFIIDCPWCKAKVAATEEGRAVQTGFNHEEGEPYGARLYVGSCPSCSCLLAGESHQVDFEGHNADNDAWSDIVRVFPKPPKEFLSYRIPRMAKESLTEADRSLQANANIAACAMLGRALEAVCRDILEPAAVRTPAPISPSNPVPPSPVGSTPVASTPKPSKRKIMLGEGIKKLKDKGVIDDRLYDWSQQLHAFRNLAAHPEDTGITRDDAEDLQSFVYAIIEYVYDLTDRYEEFKDRMAKKAKKKRPSV